MVIFNFTCILVYDFCDKDKKEIFLVKTMKIYRDRFQELLLPAEAGFFSKNNLNIHIFIRITLRFFALL